MYDVITCLENVGNYLEDQNYFSRIDSTREACFLNVKKDGEYRYIIKINYSELNITLFEKNKKIFFLNLVTAEITAQDPLSKFHFIILEKIKECFSIPNSINYFYA